MRKYAILLTCLLLALFAFLVMADSITDYFWVTVSTGVVLEGGGSGFNDGEWYDYPSLWINQWYYDHPYDPTRGKIIQVEFDYVTWDTTCVSDITVAINWSTPEWSELAHGDTLPPLPDEVGEDEELYIERHIVLDECAKFTEVQHFEFYYEITDYNPEWVSIDVRGCNFEITNGVLEHECAVDNEETSWGRLKSLPGK